MLDDWNAASPATLKDDIVHGRTSKIRETLRYRPDLVICNFSEETQALDDSKTTWHESPLNFAARQGHHEVLKVLVEYGADVNHICKGHKVEKYGATETTYFDTSLSLAAWQSKIETMKVLFDCGANVDIQSVSRVRFCADVTMQHASPLSIAAQSGNYEAVTELLKYGASGDTSTKKPFETPLYWACQSSHSSVETVEALLDGGADLRKTMKYTSKYFSSYSATPSLLVKRLLLARGFDPNFVEEDGHSLLSKALIAGDIAEMKFLTAAGARADNQRNEHKNSLMLALRSCRDDACKFSQMCEILLCAGADIDAQDKTGSTILHKAIQLELHYRVLVKFGANELVRTKEGLTPLLMCCRDFMMHRHIPWMVEATSNLAAYGTKTHWSGFYPFALAALCGRSYPYEEVTLTASFLLLRADPSVLDLACAPPPPASKKKRIRDCLLKMVKTVRFGFT